MLIMVIPLYVVLQVVVWWYVRGFWRWAAALPLIGMLPVIALTVHEYLQQSELRGLILILSCPVAIGALLIIAVGYWITRRMNPPLS